MNRKYYKDIDYKPFLLYVIFGVSAEDLQVSRKKHHIDEFPAGLDMRMFNRKENADYMDGFFSGVMGTVLDEENHEVFEQCKNADMCVAISGEVKDDATFDYMRNVGGIIRMCEQVAASGNTLILYSA